MAMPNFLIIGFEKAGTTSVYHYLKQHPQVFVSPTKETNFFIYEGQNPEILPYAAVSSFIAVNGCDDRVVQVHGFHGLRHALRFAPIHQCGFAVFDVTEGAGTCAYIAEHQECRRTAAPAFAQIRAHGFFANGVQFLRAHEFVYAFIRLTRRRTHLDPFRTAQRADVCYGDDSVSRRCGRHKVLFEAWSRYGLSSYSTTDIFHSFFLTFNRSPLTSTTSTVSPLRIF
jgi:hypothetical protein